MSFSLTWIAFALILRSAATEHPLLLQVRNTWRDTNSGHRYKQGENITLYANVAGPFDNPTETYEYYSLPYCRPPDSTSQGVPLSLGDALSGYRPVATPYVLPFRTDVDRALLCEVPLGPQDVAKFRHAIANEYYIQVLYDDLPIWAFVGTGNAFGDATPKRLLLFTHLDFDLSYNGDHVVQALASRIPALSYEITNASTAEGIPLVVQFTYSVRWREHPIAYGQRMTMYTRTALLPYYMRAHQTSLLIMCGMLAVLLLTLRTLPRRIALRSGVGPPGKALGGVPSALIGPSHASPPPSPPPPAYPSLLSACVGVGAQLLCVAAGLMALGVAGVVFPHSRGRLQLACIGLYALTGGVAGYVSGLHYKMFGGTNWVSNVLLCTVMYCGPVLVVFSFLNALAAARHATVALPLGAVVIIALLWALLALPLTALGGYLAARRTAGSLEPGCLMTHINSATVFATANGHGSGDGECGARPAAWYRRPLGSVAAQMLAAGCLPFAAVCLELYYPLGGLWSHRVFVLPAMHSAIFGLFVAISAASAVLLTVFHLAMVKGGSGWEWRSFLCGGSPALPVYGYCCYYYFRHTRMSGLLQASFFFGWNAVLCYALFLMLGSAGFGASGLFLRATRRQAGGVGS